MYFLSSHEASARLKVEYCAVSQECNVGAARSTLFARPGAHSGWTIFFFHLNVSAIAREFDNLLGLPPVPVHHYVGIGIKFVAL
jgi:hypothetical protein